MMPDPDNYYKSNEFLKFLRFFNLMEPDRNVLSISKIFTWIMLGLVVYVLFFMPENMEAIVIALGGLISSLLNYSYRRWAQTFGHKDDSHDRPHWGDRGGRRTKFDDPDAPL